MTRVTGPTRIGGIGSYHGAIKFREIGCGVVGTGMVVIKAHHLVGRAPETGLGNELWTLVGFLLTARARNWTLCLPDFTTNVHHMSATDRRIPYEELFNASALIGGMAQFGVRCARASDAMCRASRVTVDTHLHGWFAYKRGFNLERSRLREGQVHPQQQFVEQVYRSLVLSGPIEAVVRATMAANRLEPGAFGCVHARAEDDAKSIAEAGGVPTIQEYLSWARALAQRHALRALAQRHALPAVPPAVYVATGDTLNVTAMNDLEEQNAEGLAPGGLLSAPASRAGGAHGARWRGVRWANSPYKTGFDATTLDHGMNVTYMFASLIDFSICRRAGWFLGCAARRGTALPRSGHHASRARRRCMCSAGTGSRHSRAFSPSTERSTSVTGGTAPAPGGCRATTLPTRSTDLCTRTGRSARRTAPPSRDHRGTWLRNGLLLALGMRSCACAGQARLICRSRDGIIITRRRRHCRHRRRRRRRGSFLG